MAKRGAIGRLYDAVITAGKSAMRVLHAPTGEAGMARLLGPFGGGGYGSGPLQLSAAEQVQHFRGWSYRCIDYIAATVASMPPVAVRAAAPREKAEHDAKMKAWRAASRSTLAALPARTKAAHLADPASPLWTPPFAPRAFAAPHWRAKAVGAAQANEEYEFLDANHPLVRLLNDPNDPETGVNLWYEAELFNCLTGVDYVWKVHDDAGRVTELWVIPSHWVTPRGKGDERLVDYFEVSARGASAAGVVKFEPEEIIWNKRPSPLSKLYPASPLQAMASTVDAYEKTEAARNFGMDTGVMVAGVLTAPSSSNLDDGMIQRLEARFAARYQGVFNFGRPMILEGGLQWTPAPADRELAYMQSADQLKDYVIALWGLDKTVLGFGDAAAWAGAVANIRNVDYATIQPRKRVRAAVLTEGLAREFGADVKVFYPPNIPLDPDARRQDFQAAQGANAVSANDWRTHILELEPWPEDVYDRPLVNPGLVNPGDDQGAAWDQEGPGGGGEGGFGGGSEGFGGGGGGGAAGGSGGGSDPPALSGRGGGGDDAAGNDTDIAGAFGGGKRAKVSTGPAGQPVEFADPAPYGYCPECRTPGVMAERRVDGDAHCANGHAYPRRAAKYASTQIDLSGPARGVLLALAARIADADLADDGREDNPHVTVRYGLHADAPGPVAAVVRGFGPVRLTLGPLRAFRGAATGKDFDVIYAAVDSPDLLRLNEVLGALPHTDTHAGYTPHATVGYVKAGLADKYLRELGAGDGGAGGAGAAWAAGVTEEVDRLTFSTAARVATTIRLTDGGTGKVSKGAGTPPFPGAVFNEQTHRWEKPDRGDDKDKPLPKPAAPGDGGNRGRSRPDPTDWRQPDWVHAPTGRSENRYVNRFTGRVAYTGKPPKGRSEEQRRAAVEERARRLEEPAGITRGADAADEFAAKAGIDTPHLTALTGDQPGSRVTARKSAFSNAVFLSVDHPDTTAWERTLSVAADGSLELYNAMFFLRPNAQGSGFGTQAFAAQVAGAVAAGVSRIKTCAGRGTLDGVPMNGYATWPRLGYDAPLDAGQRAKLPEGLKGAKTVLDLYESKEGRDWWKENGTTTGMTFDVSPGSRSMKTLNAYLKANGKPEIEYTAEQAAANAERQKARAGAKAADAVAPVHARNAERAARAGLDPAAVRAAAEKGVDLVYDPSNRLAPADKLDAAYTFALHRAAAGRAAERLTSEYAGLVRRRYHGYAAAYGIDPGEVDREALAVGRRDAGVLYEPDEKKAIQAAYARAFDLQRSLSRDRP